MGDTREETERLLSERPDFDDALRHVLDVDAGSDRWTFEDVDLDSGTFGELVARDLVERNGDGYTVPDDDEIRRALDGNSGGTATGSAGASSVGSRGRSGFERADGAALGLDRLDGVALAGLAFALCALVGLRLFNYPEVFRDGDVVLVSNDPYMYRYWIDRLFADYGAFDPGVLDDLPTGVGDDDVVVYVALWATASLAPVARGVAIAWAPVLITAVTGLAVYVAGTRLTSDRRVGIAAVLMLALVPVHANLTSIGFVDHHAFDYLWLAVTLVALIGLRRRPPAGAGRDEAPPDTGGVDWQSRHAWGYASLLALGVTGQVFSWRGSPILLAPLALYVAVIAAVDTRAGEAPVRRNAFLLVGLLGAAVLSAGLHVGLGWGELHRGLLPGAVLLGAVVVFATAAIGIEFDVSPWAVGLVAAAAGLLAFAGLWAGTSLFDWMIRRGGSWVSAATERQTGGSMSLLSPRVLRAGGPLYVFGTMIVLAAAGAVRQSVRLARGRGAVWTAPLVYFWYLLAWTVPFVRFGGSLAVVAALLAGYAFVAFAAYIGLAVDRSSDPSSGSERPGGPDRGGLSLPSGRAAAGLLGLFLLVGLVSFVQLPAQQSALAVDDETYATATWIAEDADERGMTYPENYVFSGWGQNTVYNYHVNGQSRAYIFAEDNFRPFLRSDDPERWYERLRGGGDYAGAERRLEGGVGYIVVRWSNIADPESMYVRLFEFYGSEFDDLPALEHYRAVYVSPGGTRKVFMPVEGAIVTGQGPPDESVTVSVPVDLEHESITYQQTTETTATGRFAARVPYPGTYRVGGDAAVLDAPDVSETAVENGGFVVEPTGDESHWTFDEGRGSVAFDAESRRHGLTNGTTWTEGPNGSALAFDGDSRVTVSSAPNAGDGGFELTARFRADPGAESSSDGFTPIVATAPASGEGLRSGGYALALSDGRIAGTVGDGSEFRQVDGPRVDDGEWHRARLVWDRESVRLFLDGTEVREQPFERPQSPPSHPLYVGGPPGDRGFAGEIDEVRFEPRE